MNATSGTVHAALIRWTDILCMLLKRKKLGLVVAALLIAGVAIFLYRPGAAPNYQIDNMGYGVGDPVFARSLAGVLDAAITSGNQIEALQNGKEIFPAMLKEIRSAERSINFETYIYWSGEIATTFAEALAGRAAQGVDVNVLIDGVGGLDMNDDLVQLMRDQGVSVSFFNVPGVLKPESLAEANERTHRKLLIVDGRVGFLGGVGIADPWRGDASNSSEWRDIHFRVRGPVVAHLQSAFSENWRETSAEILHGESYYPSLEMEGDCQAFAVRSSPDGDSGRIQAMFLLAIAGAQESIRIATPYFVPDEMTLDHLVNARRRGVEIDIIIAGPHTDMPLARSASRGLWGELLETGVRIHEFQPTMYHCKVAIIDDEWTSIGSANFDNRSFKLNDEANLVVLNADFASKMSRTFDEDRDRSNGVTLEAWRNRPWHRRVRESIASFLREHL